jgi:8-oxo-dGTP pyrophosphatase MutT (NUDIX family)
VIRAAGGVVVRDGRVLLVHRPKYRDWTLPKGKCKDGESAADCALREVEEETGLSCEIVGPAGETRYRVLKGPKLVRYFLMRPLSGEFVPHDEVDEVRWVTPDEAAQELSYRRDVSLLEALELETRA